MANYFFYLLANAKPDGDPDMTLTEVVALMKRVKRQTGPFIM